MKTSMYGIFVIWYCNKIIFWWEPIQVKCFLVQEGYFAKTTTKKFREKIWLWCELNACQIESQFIFRKLNLWCTHLFVNKLQVFALWPRRWHAFSPFCFLLWFWAFKQNLATEPTRDFMSIKSILFYCVYLR